MGTQSEARSPELEKAIDIFDGNASALAIDCGISDQTISDWRQYRYGALFSTAERVADSANKKARKKAVDATTLYRELQSKRATA